MSMDAHTLIWLFPVAFMFHDFEELLFWALWLNKHGDKVRRRMPAFLAKQVSTIVEKSTAEIAFPICIIFSLTVLASFLATEYQKYGFFFLTSSAFFLHGFMHLGQAVVLRKYVPAAITSALVVIPYGLILYGRLIQEGMIDLPGLLLYFLFVVVLTIPFLLVMHKVGDTLYKQAVKLFIN